MTYRVLLTSAALCFALACDDERIVNQGDAKTLDTSSSKWDDGPKPTPDPPLMPSEPDGGLDASAPEDASTPADAGSDAALPDSGAGDAGPDAG